MMSFASNISDSQDVQLVSSRSPPASNSYNHSHIRKRPVPFSVPEIQAAQAQQLNSRLPMPSQMMPVLPNAPKSTRKKGPVPKLYDGECCKSNSNCSVLFFHCIFKFVATKQAVFIIMSFPVKDARAFTGERFLRREHFDARALKLANV